MSQRLRKHPKTFIEVPSTSAHATEGTGNRNTATFTVIDMTGLQGSRGDTGQQGPEGPQGPSGSIEDLLILVARPQ